MRTPRAAVIGGGPAGLMAAEMLGPGTLVFDAMPSLGRKFLLAGKGGLNLTHSEPLEDFLQRFGPRRPDLEGLLRAFGPEQVRAWARELGIETFVGSSRRVFPVEMKAAPLLRAWLSRLRQRGVEVRARHRWLGWDEQGRLRFADAEPCRPQVTVLALGGGSWPQLGSTGAWVEVLRERGVAVRALVAANVGWEVAWSEPFRARHAGHPVKSVAISAGGQRREGELVITDYGLEGSLLYPFCPHLRQDPRLELDLLPGLCEERLRAKLSRPQGRRSLSKHLRQRVGLEGVKAGLLRELGDLDDLVRSLKHLAVPLRGPRPLAEAISSAGGVPFEALDERLMLRELPGVFCAGEMLDWEAPTGGYLLTACLATGRAAGLGAQAWLAESAGSPKLIAKPRGDEAGPGGAERGLRG